MATTSTTTLTCPVDHNARVYLRVVAMTIVVVCEDLKAARWEIIGRKHSLLETLSTTIYKLLVSTSRIAPTIEGTVIEVELTTQRNYKSIWVACGNEKKP